MSIKRIWLLGILTLLVASNSYAGINDDFNGSSLSSAWKKKDIGKEGKEGAVVLKQEDGKLVIQFANPNKATGWHGSELMKEVSYDGDFNISTHFSWETSTSFIGFMFLILKDAQGKDIVQLGLADSHDSSPGHPFVTIGRKTLDAKAYLTISDSADLRIERIKDTVYCFWGGNLIFQEKNIAPIKKAGFLFNTYSRYFQPNDILKIDYIKELPASEPPTKKAVPTSQENLIKNPGFEEASSSRPSLPADYTSWSSIGWPKKAYLDDKNPHSGKYSLAIELPSGYTDWQKLIQFLPKTYLPNTLYRLSFWGRTDGTKKEKMQITSNVDLYTYKNGKLQYLASKTFTSTEWTYYYVDFTSPIDNSYELILWVYPSPCRLMAGVVWFDDVSLVPVEKSTVKKASQIKGLAKKIHQSIKLVKDSGYEMKMEMDLLAFDLEDFKKYKIIKQEKFSKLEDKLARISFDLEEGEDKILKDIEITESKIASYLNKQKLDKEDISKVEALEKKSEGYTDRLASLEKKINNQILSLENSISGEKTFLAQKLKQERELLREKAKKEVIDSSTGKNLKKLLVSLKNKDSSTRAKAVLETGRLEIKETIPYLIKLLDDKSYEVRRNAIYALSWMQAKEAVPALIKLAKNTNDKWVRRRATQALGQIGAIKTVPVLIELLSDSDPAVKENAIHSLGWLKDKRAVSPLLSLYEKEKKRPEDKSSTSSTNIRSDILQALGSIGDKTVTSFIISALDKKEDIKIRKNAVFALGILGDEKAISYLKEISLKKIYDDTFSLQNTAKYALYQLNKTKNMEPGIKQPDFLSCYDNFYYNTAKFHRAAGRYEETSGVIPENGNDMRRYAQRIGINDIIPGCHVIFPVMGDFQGKGENLGIKVNRALKDMDKKELKCYPSAEGGGLNKNNINSIVSYYRDYPAFAGFWFEEGTRIHLNPLANFKNYLQRKYSSEELKRLGINLKEVKPYDFRLFERQEERFTKPVQWTEFYEFKEEEALENWRELVEWLHGLRKGTSFIVSISSGDFAGSQSMKTYPGLSEVIDMNGIEPSYCSLSYDNAFMAELARDGEVRPVGMEVYAFRKNPPVKMYEAGVWLSALHAQQFFIFTWGRVFKYPGTVYYYQPGFWEALKRAFTGMAKVEEYLINTDSPHKVALVSSGRTNAVIYRPKNFDSSMSSQATYTSYFSSLVGIYQAICQSHIQVDSIWTETLTKEKLKRYKILVLPDAKSMTTFEEGLIREWVKEGGFLITTGGTSLYDQWGRKRDNYGLSDVLGVKFLKEIKRRSKEKVVITKSDTVLGKMNIGDTISLNTNSGYDLVKAITGEVLATWGNGDPGIVKNSYGEGGSLFITSIYAGSHCKTSEKRVFPLRRDFYPGVRELLAGAVKGGLKVTNTEIPFVVENCPKEVEVVIRTQHDKKRLILHLLNYNAHKVDKVKGVRVKVLVPPSQSLEAFYPKDGQKIAYIKKGDYIGFNIRDFDVHEMVSIEY